MSGNGTESEIGDGHDLEGRVKKCEDDITNLQRHLGAVVEDRILEKGLEGAGGLRRHPHFYFLLREHVMAMEKIKQMVASTMAEEMSKLHSAMDSKLSQTFADLNAKLSKVSGEIEAQARTTAMGDVKSIGDKIDSSIKVIDARIDTLTSKLGDSNTVWQSALANKFELFQETARHAVSTAENTAKAQTGDRRFVQAATVVLGGFMVYASIFLWNALDKKDERFDQRLVAMGARLDAMERRNDERFVALTTAIQSLNKSSTSPIAPDTRP